MKKIVSVVLIMMFVIGFTFTVVWALDHAVRDGNDVVVISQSEKMRLKNVPAGIPPEEAIKMANGERDKFILETTAKKSGTITWSFPIKQECAVMAKTIYYLNGQWLQRQETQAPKTEDIWQLTMLLFCTPLIFFPILGFYSNPIRFSLFCFIVVVLSGIVTFLAPRDNLLSQIGVLIGLLVIGVAASFTGKSDSEKLWPKKWVAEKSVSSLMAGIFFFLTPTLANPEFSRPYFAYLIMVCLMGIGFSFLKKRITDKQLQSLTA